jgi:hypothetical protein
MESKNDSEGISENNFNELEFDFPSAFFTEKEINIEKLIRIDLCKENKLKHIEALKKKNRKITNEKKKLNKKRKLDSLTKEERIINYTHFGTQKKSSHVQ